MRSRPARAETPEGAGAQPAPAPGVGSGGHRRRNVAIVLIAAALVLALLVLLLLAMALAYSPGDPAIAVEHYLESVADGRSPDTLYWSTSFQRETSARKGSGSVDADAAFRAGKARVTSLSDRRATVEVDLAPPGGAVRTAEFHLALEIENLWKIEWYGLRDVGPSVP